MATDTLAAPAVASSSLQECAPRRTYKEHLNVIKGFCDKSDGKDKLTALIQYTCMFLSANEPGKIKKIQASVTAARKIFRVMRPLESLVPILNAPGFNSASPTLLQAINKLKACLMALYFAADHVVWAGQIGLSENKPLLERAQKVSLYSWALGSVCTIAAEVWEITRLTVVRREGELLADYERRLADARRKIDDHMFLLVHAVIQAALAGGLLQVLAFKPRMVGFLGLVASAMNCYLLLPTYPKLTAPVKAKAT